jgi:NAD(P)H dehydrogenase (quinone)
MEQPKVSVIYHGVPGALQTLAMDVAAGAEEAGALVRVRRIAEQPGTAHEGTAGTATPADVHWADAVVLGSPSRYGSLAAPLRSYLDALAGSEGERLKELVWSGFATDDGVLHGGHEATLMALFRALFPLGGVFVAAGHSPDPDKRALARRTGRDVAILARRLRVGAATGGGREPVTT